MLLLALLLGLTGCGAWIKNTYRTAEAHREVTTVMPVSTQETPTAVSTRNELRGAILSFIRDWTEHGVIEVRGYLGDIDADLAETVRYAQAYTFIYSKRAGTPAAEIDDPTPHEVILERFNRLVKVIETTAHEYNQGELHTVVPALIEGTSKKNDAVLLGKSPKNQTVHAPIPVGYSIDQLIGKIVDVDVDVAKTWYLSGSVVGEPR